MVRASLLRVGRSLHHVLTAAIGVLQNLLFGGKQKEYLVQCYGATTFSITTRSIMTLGLRGFYETLGIDDSKHNNALHYAEYVYDECHVLFIVMLNFIVLSVIMLNFVVMNVAAPILQNF
jgi:hypothetical protein